MKLPNLRAVRNHKSHAMSERFEDSGDSEVNRDRDDLCPYCGQNLNERACEHWVASLSDDSDGFDTVTPLYFGWSNHCNERHDKLIVCFNKYFEALCALCDQVEKEDPRKRKAILNRAQKLPSSEATIVRQAIKILDDHPKPREDFETIPSLLSELGPPLKIFFTELFLQSGGSPAKADWGIDHSPGLWWSGTNYFAQDAEKCLDGVMQQCKMATDHIRRLSRKC